MGHPHEPPDSPAFAFDAEALGASLERAAFRFGTLHGMLKRLGTDDLQDSALDAMAAEVVDTGVVGGSGWNGDAVRAALARRRGLIGGGTEADASMEAVVSAVVDAKEHPEDPLTEERLLRWHAALFPHGGWRTGSMHVMEAVGTREERVRHQAPDGSGLKEEVGRFVRWFNAPASVGILSAGLAQLWFLRIHPFDDGNGRMGRWVLDLALAKATPAARYAGVPARMMADRKAYYAALASVRPETLDATAWLAWYLDVCARAAETALEEIETVSSRASFWSLHADKTFNDRQRAVLSRMLTGYGGTMTAKRWAKMTHATPIAAVHDLSDLVTKGVLVPDREGVRNTGYRLATV